MKKGIPNAGYKPARTKRSELATAPFCASQRMSIPPPTPHLAGCSNRHEHVGSFYSTPGGAAFQTAPWTL